MEAFVLTDRAYKRLNTTFAQLCWKAAGKAATDRTEQGNFRSITNEAVTKYWKFIPLKAELRYRKLKWLQSMVQHPEDSIQVPTALFGQMRCEAAPTILPNGTLCEDCINWAKQLTTI